MSHPQDSDQPNYDHNSKRLGAWNDHITSSLRCLCEGCVAAWQANGYTLPILVEWMDDDLQIRITDVEGPCENCVAMRAFTRFHINEERHRNRRKSRLRGR